MLSTNLDKEKLSRAYVITLATKNINWTLEFIIRLNAPLKLPRPSARRFYQNQPDESAMPTITKINKKQTGA